ncbi:uncharacterized protein RCC_06097 [Ramularia collo-cygni]|uniref:Zn(2)-C6 fungal-type domain-containing protein n=1 Tax=Ramularia collo-cygni TaxID=112498 RepID=A0A2D3VEQ2_9PEZI|nr:uncharacterized protein RCC_06097 [Ramularia collo-cygni]CZT20239.1 uncharacterized protein RCC_06097 [Ramularia collo-cygni]
MSQTPNLKRSFQRMMQDQAHGMVNMENVSYHDFQPGAFYTPPPPQQPQIAPHQVLFSNPQPFQSPNEFVHDGYLPTGDSMGYFPTHRSLSEGFVHQNNANDSFSSMSSGSSSCNVSIGPATPPPAPHYHMPTKFPAVPITPSHVVPRQKAKRTATACEECRKRKQKCDGESPCQSCKEQKLDCRYREVSPTKKDNSMEKLVALIESFGKSMEALNQRLDAMGSTVNSIQSRLDNCQCGTVEINSAPCKSHV